MRKKIRTAAGALLNYTGIPRKQDSERLRNRRDAVFIWIPKTAGTSIWQAMDVPKLKSLHLAKHRFAGHGPVTFCHMDYARLVEKGYVSQAFDNSAYKFSFVRNPYDRAVSLFYYMKRIKKRKVDPKISFLDFYTQFKQNGFEPIGLYNRKGLSQCNPQVRWTEHVKLDHIGKLETIDEDTARIMEALGLTYSPVEKTNVTDHPDYSSCYCPESKALIEEVYREDFETFGYEHENF